MYLLQSVSVSQSCLVDSTIQNRTGSICTPCVFLPLSLLGLMMTDDRARAAPDLTPGPIAGGYQQAGVEVGWYNCNNPGAATELTRVIAARPHHCYDRQRAVRWAGSPFVQWQNAHEPQYHRELQSRRGGFTCPERAGPEEKVVRWRGASAITRVCICACKYSSQSSLLLPIVP
jgi:hypothetical protein